MYVHSLFNSLSSPEVTTTGLLKGPVPLAFTAATVIEYLVHACSLDIVVEVVPLGTFSIILSSDPTLPYWIT